MNNATQVEHSVLARIIAAHPSLIEELDQMVAPLPEKERGEFYKKVMKQSVNGSVLENSPIKDDIGIAVLSADQIITTKWPEPVWAIPDLLPVGLTILAGAPKVGKSWLSMQLAKAIATGGEFLGKRAAIGPVLIFALEDSPQRLQGRMKAMGWPANLNVHFVTIPRSRDQGWNMLNGGVEKLSLLMQQNGYRLVAIDTLSRAIPGDQQDVQVMTRALTPLQEIAHQMNCSLLINDHHRKAGAMNADVIADILGSTAKGAMADTVWSLYRERGKNGAKLAITGRDVEEQTLQLEFDTDSYHWRDQGSTTNLNITERRKEILDALHRLGRCSTKDLEQATGQPSSHLHTRLQDLVSARLVNRLEEGSNVFYEPSDLPVIDVTTCKNLKEE